MLKFKRKLEIVSLLIVLFVTQQLNCYAFLNDAQLFLSTHFDAQVPIEYETSSPRFEKPLSSLRIGVVKFEDTRKSECNIIYNVPLSRGYTDCLVKQLSQSNIFKEVKEIPAEILKEFNGCDLTEDISCQIREKTNVDVLLFGNIEILRYKSKSFVFRVEGITRYILFDINSNSVIWSNKFETNCEEVPKNIFSTNEIKLQMGRLGIKAIKTINERFQENITSFLTVGDTKDYSKDLFEKKFILKRNLVEDNAFYKIKKMEIEEISDSRARFVLLIELVGCIVLGVTLKDYMGGSVYYLFPVIAVPSWFIAKSIKSETDIKAEKIFKESRDVFFNKD